MSHDHQVLHRGSRFDVELVQLPLRGGGIEARELIRHPGSVVILPIASPRHDTDERVVMIRNTRFSVKQTLWELPAGTLEPGEDPAVCAAREVTEETGFRAGELYPLLEFYAVPGWCTERMYVFVARGLTPGPQQLEADEQIVVHTLGWPEVLGMLRRNEIVDGKTIAALLYYRQFAAGPERSLI